MLILLLCLGYALACHPNCTWACSDPVCSAVCQPVCTRPNCTVVNNTAPCDARCTEQCPDDMCEADQCPACSVLCEAPLPACGPDAEIQCGPLTCAWQCFKPSNCPPPVCELQCEKPACELGTDVILIPDCGLRTAVHALAVLIMVLVIAS